MSDLCIEHKGKTLHLLKEKTKDVPQSRKRRKLPVYGESNEEQKHEESPKPVSSFQKHTTNVIGNVEDFNTGII